MDRAKKNVGILALCQALLLTNNVTLIAVNALIGHALAPNKALATLPITTYVIGAALTTMPASLLMRRIGRRGGFMGGSLLGLLGASLCTWGLGIASFWLICFGTLVMGMYNAFGQYYRFAAADVASSKFKSKAISLVLAGGIVGGIIGPELTKWSKDWVETPFMGSYLLLMGLSVAATVLVSRVDIPPSAEARQPGSGRPLSRIVMQPVFAVAALGAMIGYGAMNLLMSVTPLAMQHHGHHFNDAAMVLEWHVIGMYGPAFFTGSLINRFGVLKVMLWGAVLMLASVFIALAGVGFIHFLAALFLLGVGWSFLYVGGTTLLTESYRPEEKAKAQGANDFLVFATMAVSSLSSGALLTRGGWETVNVWALPFLVVAGAATAWLAMLRRMQKTASRG